MYVIFSEAVTNLENIYKSCIKVNNKNLSCYAIPHAICSQSALSMVNESENVFFCVGKICILYIFPFDMHGEILAFITSQTAYLPSTYSI